LVGKGFVGPVPVVVEDELVETVEVLPVVGLGLPAEEGVDELVLPKSLVGGGVGLVPALIVVEDEPVKAVEVLPVVELNELAPLVEVVEEDDPEPPIELKPPVVEVVLTVSIYSKIFPSMVFSKFVCCLSQSNLSLIVGIKFPAKLTAYLSLACMYFLSILIVAEILDKDGILCNLFSLNPFVSLLIASSKVNPNINVAILMFVMSSTPESSVIPNFITTFRQSL
jgi:hypothetical protein